MKRSQVTIGAVYVAKVGAETRLVKVVSTGRYDANKFIVATEDGKPLPKERGAAALHAIAEKLR